MEIFPDYTGLPQFILSIFFLGMVLIQLFWLLFFYIRIAFHKEKINDAPEYPVSVIIAARNEEDNLFEFLPSILEQDYKQFEVVVIDDQSVDNSASILKAYQEKYPHLRVIHLQKNQHLASGKKLALTIGIKGAKYEHLLLTDADCEPSSNQWLKSMTNQFTDRKEIALGYAPYRKEKSFLNKVIQIDTAFIALNYLSFAKAGVPYMGVGRNLGYTKRVFMENSGFKSHYALQSGDDDLFIQEVAKKKNCTISLSPLSFCYSEAKKTWKDWFSQKSRHYTTSGRYPLFKKLLLGIYPLSLILLLVSFVTLLVNSWMCWLFIGAIFFLAILKWIILGLALKKMELNSFVWSILFWDVFYAVFTPILYYTTEQSTTAKWK